MEEAEHICIKKRECNFMENRLPACINVTIAQLAKIRNNAQFIAGN